MTKLDQEMLDALRVYDSNFLRKPQWGEDFFGIDPFYIALGEDLEEKFLDKYIYSNTFRYEHPEKQVLQDTSKPTSKFLL